ncbi:MAG: phosphoribosyltransferase family protein [Sulfurimonas sp.]|uniref:phosphoribosyltransferase n=1 Tax=Sulfurimonas sp. TaxID=2022749 RepID=UPI0025D1EF2C|nr:phosphoribosyltransferase family protein [Sulfurimonas sp.]MCK9455188.1 phosphoribosyltransferase [Sulfurimonas sp.]
MKYYSYEDFKTDTTFLIDRVRDAKFEAIVAVARGGLTLSHAMAEGLDIRQVQSIRTELYDKTIKRGRLNIFDTCHLEGVKKVLVVDDIADSGDTLEAVMEYLEKKYEDIEFVSCTLFYKKTSLYEPHFWINEADDWIDFFWERDFLK